MFIATFNNAKAVFDRTVNPDGRIPRVSEFKGCRVSVVVLDLPPVETDDEETTHQELDISITFPTEELVELTTEEVAKAFGNGE